MPDLIAQGPSAEQRWRRALPDDRTVVVGRAAGVWSTPWDDHISRQHVEARWRRERLEVRVLAAASNPVFFRGRKASCFQVRVGEHFVIGDTQFSLADSAAQAAETPAPAREHAFSSQALRTMRYRGGDPRLEALGRLPEVILNAASDAELHVRLVNLLLTGAPAATTAAIVCVRGDDSSAPIDVLHWDRRLAGDGEFRPSAKLIRHAVATGQSVLHLWDGPATGAVEATASPDADWAFCTPVPGDDAERWTLYVAGRRADGATQLDPAHFHDDLKFAELAADTLASLRRLRRLERSQASLRQFFSPQVVAALEGQDPDIVLAPREALVSVLFCDLRGFARRAEQQADDLFGLLQRVSQALGVTTSHILAEGGVVGDFHGDAAMGFWGWPIEYDDAAARACRAAQAIRREFAQLAARRDHPLADFRIGIGLATGPAVAGKIGTIDQVKVTVFGPVVNLAARLEAMTKRLRAPILLDEATAAAARRLLADDEGRVRHLGAMLPYGLATPLAVSELLPAEIDRPRLTADHLAAYERAVSAFQAGRWHEALELLHQVPADDETKDFLLVYIAQHNRTPPPGWPGWIELDAK